MLVINHQSYVCSLDYAVSLIKGKWKAVIICHLNNHSYRFLELQRELPGISEKVLTEKLRELEKDALVERISYPEMPPRVEYRLTAAGLALFNVLASLQHWGNAYIADHHPAAKVTPPNS